MLYSSKKFQNQNKGIG